MHFNSTLIKEYRLIGFDNKRDAVADTLIDIEGGEVGSGSSVLAMFEIVLQDQGLISGDMPDKEGVANLQMRYNLIGDTTTLLMENSCPLNYVAFNDLDKELQFAAAVAMFGLKVKQSKYIKEVDWLEIENIAKSSYDANNYLQTQFLQLIEKAKKIYKGKKIKKRREDD